MKRGAGLLIFRPDGHAFLIRRSKSVRHPGEWDLPGGGVEPGETPGQAACREAAEETGDVLPSVSQFGSVTSAGYTTFLCSMDQTDAEMWKPPLSSEADEYGWFDPSKPPSPLRPNVKTVFDHIS